MAIPVAMGSIVCDTGDNCAGEDWARQNRRRSSSTISAAGEYTPFGANNAR